MREANSIHTNTKKKFPKFVIKILGKCKCFYQSGAKPYETSFLS